jgi:omega-amidase
MYMSKKVKEGQKMAKIKVAAIQMPTVTDKMQNVRTAGIYLEKIKDEKPDFVILPEMFCCPYQTQNFPVYAEEEGGPVWQQLSEYAKQYGIYLIGGSMPEKDAEGKVYNTSYIFDRQGKQIGKHRKVHLFDIDVTGGQTFKESDTLTAGDHDTVFDTEFGRMGVMLCFDIRFPELARMMVNDGAKAIFVPAAFNMTTGPAHWELSFRTRALDNQIYMIGCAPMRDESAGYISWGHSIVTDPWGRVIDMLDEKEGVLLTELDLDYEEQVREELPLLKSRRKDMYRLEKLCK